MMHYVYILKSGLDNKLYIGKTDNLKERYENHQTGKVKSTKSRRPFSLVFYEAFSHKEAAARRERYFKTSKGKTTLKIMLKELFQ